MSTALARLGRAIDEHVASDARGFDVLAPSAAAAALLQRLQDCEREPLIHKSAAASLLVAAAVVARVVARRRRAARYTPIPNEPEPAC